MRKSHLASLACLILIAVPLAIIVHLLRSETGFPRRSVINASSPAEKPETCLRLGFAARSGLYLANVRVAISDANGNPVTELISDGPWLQVTLTPGIYNVTASFDGRARELRNLELVDGDTSTHVIYWDVNIVPVELMVQSPRIRSV